MIVTRRPTIPRRSPAATPIPHVPRERTPPAERVGPPRRQPLPRSRAVVLRGRSRTGHRPAGVAEITVAPADSRERRFRVRVRLDLIVPLVLFVFALTQNLRDVGITPYHPDESRWLNRGHYVEDFLNPFGATWDDQYLTRGQPPLGSYVMGIGELLQGKSTHPNEIWDFYYGGDWNTLVGAMPTPDVLNAGRRTNAVIGALVVLCVYFIGKALTNRVGGALGALFLAVHPLQIWIASQALSDQLLILLLALAMLAAMWLARKPGRWRALTLGVLLGFGGADKLTPLLLSLPLAAMGAFYLGHSYTRFAGTGARTDRRLGWSLLWQPVIAFATFIAVYPYLWPSPVNRTIELFRWRQEEMGRQIANWPTVAVSGPLAALDRIGFRLTDIQSSSGRIAASLASLVGIEWHPHGIDFIPVLIGALIMITLVIKSNLRSPQTLAIALLVCESAAIVVGMKVDFYRYHLPIVFAMAVCVGVCFGAIWRQMQHVAWWRLFNLVPGITVFASGGVPAGAPASKWLPGLRRAPRPRRTYRPGTALRPSRGD